MLKIPFDSFDLVRGLKQLRSFRQLGIYVIEPGETEKSDDDPGCEGNSYHSHGFVYKDGDAFAIYYLSWSEQEDDQRVDVALAVGEWDELTSTSDDRDCFGVAVTASEDEILIRIVNPDESPWPKTELFGDMMSRSESLSHPFKQELFVILEDVIKMHPCACDYLGINS